MKKHPTYRVICSVRRMVMLLLITSALFNELAIGQSAPADTVIDLPSVYIHAQTPVMKVIGDRQSHWTDSMLTQYDNRSLDNVLMRESSAFIRSYGNGGIATISLRGSNSSQVAVTWNGVQLANPMVGVPDFSLIPASSAFDASISYGGNSASTGSGAIGGVVQLNSNNAVPNGFTASVNSVIGSFGLWDQDVTFNYGNRRMGGRTAYFHSLSENDFPYQASPGAVEQQLENARVARFGVLQDVYIRPSDNDLITGHFWWQSHYREIPPTTVQNTSLASQDDQTVRSVIEWTHTRKVLEYQFKAAYFRDRIQFDDPQTLIEATSVATTAMAEAKATFSIDPTQSFMFGMSHYRLSGDTEAYDKRQDQNRTAMFLRHHQDYRKWSLRFDLRQELIDGNLSPFLIAVGMNYEPVPWIKLHGKVSRDYRLPGINDLYWLPGGNPDLKPEKGWSEELGVTFRVTKSKHTLEVDMTGFNRKITDWILWGIAPGETFWSAHNLTEVHSRGIESTADYHFALGLFNVSVSAGYTYTLSTNEVALDNPKIDAGQQLTYVPEHRAFGMLGIQLKGLEFKYDHNYTGEVISERGDMLEGYSTGNIRVSFQKQFNHIGIRPSFEMLNVWNTDYRVIQYRPMPGRNYRVGLYLIFGKHS